MYGTSVTEVIAILSMAAYQVDRPLFAYISSNDLQVQPLGASATGQAGTGLIYLIPTIVVTFLLVRGLRHNPRRWLPVLMGVSIGLGVFSIDIFDWFWLATDTTQLLILVLVPLVLIFCFIMSVTGKTVPAFAAPFQLWFSIGAALLLAIAFPITTIVALCMAAAVWDIYAVFRGPLKVLARQLKPATAQGPGLFQRLFLLNFKYGSLGLGDVFFYSLIMLACFKAVYQAAIPTFGALCLGTFITFYLLKSRKGINALPGLPLPILFSLVTMAIFHFGVL